MAPFPKCAIVDTRTRIGDWEVDLVDTKVALLRLLNARADFTLCCLLPIKRLAVLMTLLSNYSCHLNAGLKH